MNDQQTQVQFNIYQGEARLTRDNIKLGELSVALPPSYRGKATQLPIDVRFSYDINGLLEVDIGMVDSEKRYNLVIQNGAKQLSDEEISQSKERLSNLKVHPRDQAQNRSLLARAERLYAQHLGFEREQLARLIGWYESILDEQDPQKIRQANTDLNQSLEQFEREDWF